MEKPEAEVIYEAAPVTVRKYHLQIRIDENGPKKKDGRNGRILIEDTDAPYEVVKWIRSEKCKKAGKGSGKKAIVWINDEQIGEAGTPDPNFDDDEPAPLPAIPVGDLNIVASVLPHMRAQLDALQKDLTAARKARDEEVAACNEQIADARKRVADELKREDDEMRLLSERRRAMAEERSQMSADLKTDAETFSEIRKGMAKYNDKGAIETISTGIANVAQGIQGTPLENMAAAFTALILKKAGVNVPTE